MGAWLAAKMFVNANDKNGDGVLTASEWAHLDTGGFLVDFKIGEAGGFKRLDNNRNGKIEALELEHAVRFETSPCRLAVERIAVSIEEAHEI